MTAIALLGPVLVRVAELLARLPVLLLSGVGGRLALADIRRRPRRIATAVSFVAFGVSFVGANYFINVTLAHGIVVEGRERLVADAAVSAPGPGLASGALQEIAAQPGVSTAVGLTPTTVFIPDPGNDSAFGEAVTPGPLGEVLNLRVASGSLDHFGPGDIALSKTVVGPTAVDTHVGDTITTFLADGTRYRAKVVAIYSHSLGFADALVPAGAAGGGHFGSTTMAEVLVRGAPGEAQTTLSNELEGLSGRFAGLNVASRSVVNAQAQQYTSDENYENNGFLGLIALLAVVALVNTLVMATVERRGACLAAQACRCHNSPAPVDDLLGDPDHRYFRRRARRGGGRCICHRRLEVAGRYLDALPDVAADGRDRRPRRGPDLCRDLGTDRVVAQPPQSGRNDHSLVDLGSRRETKCQSSIRSLWPVGQ